MRDKIAKNGQNSVFSILKSTPTSKSTPLLVLVVLTNMSYACCIFLFPMFSSRIVFFPHVFYHSCSTSSLRQAPSSMLSRCSVAPPPPPTSFPPSPTQCSAQACFGWKILASCLFVGAAPGDRWPTFLPFLVPIGRLCPYFAQISLKDEWYVGNRDHKTFSTGLLSLLQLDSKVKALFKSKKKW